MYYEDLLDTAVNDESFVNDESSVEFKLRQKELTDSLKKLDKHYEKYSFPFNKTWTDGQYYKRITIENYGSTGTQIRNAVTGARYNFIVAGHDDDILFKVTDSTGRKGREPLMLYYDSPEQYENHKFTIVKPEIKEKWYKRIANAQQSLNM